MLITQAGSSWGQCCFPSENRVQWCLCHRQIPQKELVWVSGRLPPSPPLAPCQKWPSHRASASRGPALWSLYRAALSSDPVITALSIPQFTRKANDPGQSGYFYADGFCRAPCLAVWQEAEKPLWKAWPPTLGVLLRKRHQKLFCV